MNLSFHGAAQGVTGSCHLLTVGNRRILIDCGLFQGSQELHEENAADFGFEPGSIDFVLLTHAHLDHCGRLPLLVKRGFRGEIIATTATFELGRLVLLDAAHLQEEEAQFRAGSVKPHKRSEAKDPLYTIVDTMDCIGRFGRAPSYGRAITVCPGVQAVFYNAGHILGSASILIQAEDSDGRCEIVFSGDIGNSNGVVLRPPDVPAEAQVVVMETTYADRLHRPLDASLREFYGAVNAALRRGGNVIIPTFALERAQELLFFLREAMEQNKLASSIPVFLDSPMAISATQLFERHPDDFSSRIVAMFQSGKDPFKVPNLQLTRERADSVAINAVQKGAIIIAGSGMCTGGRVRHHLRHNLSRPECGIIFVGYAAQGTLARRIIDGAREVHLFGEPFPVRASIHTINGFSAHADQKELLSWQKQIGGKEKIILVHGETSAMHAFAKKLHGPEVLMPALNEQVSVPCK